jgi:hypothetical protein
LQRQPAYLPGRPSRLPPHTAPEFYMDQKKRLPRGSRIVIFSGDS